MPDQATRWVAVARLNGAFGVRGDARVIPIPLPVARILPDSSPERTEKANWLLEQTTWWLGRESPPDQPLSWTEGRWQGQSILVRITGCENREELQTMTGMRIWWPDPDLPDPGFERYYWHRLIGMRVLASLEDQPEVQEEIGIVEELLATGSNDVLVVRAPDGTERLLPFIRDVIRQVDENAQRLHVCLMIGL